MPKIHISNAKSHPQMGENKRVGELAKDWIEIHPYQPKMPHEAPRLSMGLDELRKKTQHGTVLEWQWHKDLLLNRRLEAEISRKVQRELSLKMEDARQVEILLKTQEQRYQEIFREVGNKSHEQYLKYCESRTKANVRNELVMATNQKALELTKTIQRMIDFINMFSATAKRFTYQLKEAGNILSVKKIFVTFLQESSGARSMFASLSKQEKIDMMGEIHDSDALQAETKDAYLKKIEATRAHINGLSQKTS